MLCRLVGPRAGVRSRAGTFAKLSLHERIVGEFDRALERSLRLRVRC
jgi:hypothetical protein